MARSRKPSDEKDAHTDGGAADTPENPSGKDGVEDAEVIEESGPEAGDTNASGEPDAADPDAGKDPEAEAPEVSTDTETATPDTEQVTEEVRVEADAQDSPRTEDTATGNEPEPERPEDRDVAASDETADITEPEAEGAARDDVRDTAADADMAAADDTPKDSETPPAPQPAPVERRSSGPGFLALVFGGIVAALVGAIAVLYVFPEVLRGENEETLAQIEALNERVDALQSDIAAEEAGRADLAAALDGLSGDVDTALSGLRAELSSLADALPDDTARLDAIDARLEELAQATGAIRSEVDQTAGQIGAGVTELENRLEVLELRPVPEALDAPSLDEALTDFQAELSTAVESARAEIVAAQEAATEIAARAAEEAAEVQRRAAEEAAERERLAAEEAAAREAAAQAEAEALREEAEAAAAAAARQAAVSRILAAIENGEPFADDLAALDAGTVPDALAARASEGVPTLLELQQSFPDAARQALDASLRAGVDGSLADRAMAFLRVQSGVRSLEAREGDDPDAVLSRAEAALRSGDLSTALAEIEALPEAGRAEMSAWADAAAARVAAEEAALALAQPANDN